MANIKFSGYSRLADLSERNNYTYILLDKMGLLSQGKPLDWEETRKYAKYVQERGIAQFINVYHEAKNRADGPFKWGDEVCSRKFPP